MTICCEETTCRRVDVRTVGVSIDDGVRGLGDDEKERGGSLVDLAGRETLKGNDDLSCMGRGEQEDFVNSGRWAQDRTRGSNLIRGRGWAV